MARLAQELPCFLPPRPFRLLGAFGGKNLCEVKLASSARDVNIGELLELCLFPELEDYKEEEDDRCCQICLEEVLDERRGGIVLVANWCETGPELSDKNKAVENSAI
jgi:hypothetical protein